MTEKPKKTFWQKLEDFFSISGKDLKAWKKKNYESRQRMGRTSDKEDAEYEKEWEKKNRRY